MKKNLVSGLQSSGNLHLGNYLGAIRNWVNLQEEYQCYFFLADLHAITVPKNPEFLQSSIIQAGAAYLASGIDHKKSIIFAQSSVKEHAELAWILNCNTPLGWLKRMTQFKDKAGKNQDASYTGLFTYPILMAADILLYDAYLVPVGEDQKQHIELTRDIAEAINRKFEQQVFVMPEPLIPGSEKRIKSLKDATKKMSKDDPSDFSRINLLDDSDTIMQKIKKAQTDSFEYISFDPDTRPAISNLLIIYSSLTHKHIKEIVELYQDKLFSEFKKDLAEIVIEALRPINKKLVDYMQNQDYVIEVLKEGSEKAREYAEAKMHKIKRLFGFID